MGTLLWLLLVPFFGWFGWAMARNFGWLGYLGALAVLVGPTAAVLPTLNGNASAGNFGPDLFILFVMFPSIALAAICGGFGVAKWRATREWKRRHGPDLTHTGIR